MTLLAAFYITIIVALCALQNVVQKSYNKKFSNRGALTFCTFSALVALFYFGIRAIIKDSLVIPPAELIPYAILYGIGYSLASIFILMALGAGPLSLTSLVISYSLLVPTGWGIIFDGDDVGATFYIGISLLIVSIFLINSKKEDTKVSLKWAIFAALALIGNGTCSTAQSEQSERFSGAYDDTCMIIGLGIVVILTATLTFIQEKDDISDCLKRGPHLIAARGVINASANLLVMVVVGLGVNQSLMFPIQSAGGIILSYILSVAYYKEKLDKKQTYAVLLGATSIVFLNI